MGDAVRVILGGDPVVSLSWIVFSVSIVGLLILPTLSLPSLIV